MKKLNCILALSMILLSSCGSERGWESEIFAENYITRYMKPNKMKLYRLDYELGYTRYIRVSALGQEITDTDKAEFKMYSERYNDTSFDKWVFSYEISHNLVIAEPLSTVKVTCDKDIDETHPAGSQLGDVVTINAASVYKYMESGYTLRGPNPSVAMLFPYYLNCGPYYYPVEKHLNELTSHDLTLLYPEFLLKLPEELAPGEYTFNVSIQIEDLLLSNSITYIAK